MPVLGTKLGAGKLISVTMGFMVVILKKYKLWLLRDSFILVRAEDVFELYLRIKEFEVAISHHFFN